MVTSKKFVGDEWSSETPDHPNRSKFQEWNPDKDSSEKDQNNHQKEELSEEEKQTLEMMADPSCGFF